MTSETNTTLPDSSLANSETDGHVSWHQAAHLVPSSHGTTSSGFARLLECCGVMKMMDAQPGESSRDTTSGQRSLEFDAAAAKLLRQSQQNQSDGYTQIAHIRQIETWDCGIACLQMSLQWLRSREGTTTNKKSPSSSVRLMDRNLLLSGVDTQSIWTVDILMLLEDLLNQKEYYPETQQHATPSDPYTNTTYLFCSQVMGVNTAHSTTGYYEQAFLKDSTRVNRLCEEMTRLQLPMLCPFHLTFSQMIDLISHDHCIAILLVDNNVLLKNNHAHDYNQQQQDTYMGHYVIVCGISRHEDDIVAALAPDNLVLEEQGRDPYCCVVVNPGIEETIMFVSPQRLERAWRADGTDCDVIFIAKHKAFLAT